VIVALVGNQNCGKTTLFNRLTGGRRKVGNFPGVTTEISSGKLMGNPSIKIVDLPGLYSLNAYTNEEKLTLNFIKESHADIIINIVDATNLNRNLYLTMQLLESQTPIILAINMADELKKNGTEINVDELKRLLGCEVFLMACAKNQGVSALSECLIQNSELRIQNYGNINKDSTPMPYALCPMPSIYAEIVNSRYNRIDTLLSKVITKQGENKAQMFSRKIDKLLTHKVLALPIFLIIMGLVFYLSFGLVGNLISDLVRDFIQNGGKALSGFLTKRSVPPLLVSFAVDGAYAGVASVISFLPMLVLLFFFLSLIEDTGYMARVAFVLDKLLSKIGLNGKAVVPVLLGFGCSVPAYMSCRTLPLNHERQASSAMVGFIPCSAKIPLIALFASVFFAKYRAVAMLAVYILSMVLGVITQLILKKTKFKNQKSGFILELPPYRMPSLKNVSVYLFEKAKVFLVKTFTVILLSSVFVWFLLNFGINFKPAESIESSILAYASRAFAPLFAPIGLGDWRIVSGILSGIVAKEAILSSLAVLLGAGATVESGLIAPLSAMFTARQAVSFLIFTTLYTPCAVACSACIKESPSKTFARTTLFMQTAIAYGISFLFYFFSGLF